ncbi:MAG: hypothetical protein JXR49_22475 [Acidobacteria bacterium]|nr:hypothetical protein [Acidobacteriota bacterium]
MLRSLATLTAVILIMPAFCVVKAQQIVNIKAALLQFIEGEVLLDANPVEFHDGIRIQVENDQRLDTKKGKVELLLPFYTYFRIGENSSLRITGTSFNDMEMTLEQGACLIEVLGAPSGNRIGVRISESVVAIEKEGLYRIDHGSGELRVHSGEAKVVWKNRKVKVQNGRMVHLAVMSKPEKFKMDICNPLHRWAAQRSFVLFIAPGARGYRYWVPESQGWLRHSGYGVRYYSEYFYWQALYTRAQDKMRGLYRKPYGGTLVSPARNSDHPSVSIERDQRKEMGQVFSMESSMAYKNMKLADPTAWKEDPDLSGCD